MESRTEYNTDFYQITRRVTTTLTIDGIPGGTSETRFVDSIRKKETREQIEHRARDYMTFNYGDKAVGSTFTESVCQKKVDTETVQAAKLEFKEGYGGSKQGVCTVDWTRNGRFFNFK